MTPLGGRKEERGFVYGNVKVRGHLEVLGAEVSIILKWILNKNKLIRHELNSSVSG